MDYARWHSIAERLKQTKSERNRYLFWPQPPAELETLAPASGKAAALGSWGSVRQVHDAARSLHEQFTAEAQRIDADRRFTDEGKAEAKQRLYAEEIAPKLAKLRSDILSPSREAATARLSEAKQRQMALPNDAYQVQVDAEIRAYLRSVPKGERFKASQALPLEARRAIAAAPPELSGLSGETHGLVKAGYLEHVGSPSDTEAEKLVEALGQAGDALDFAQVDAELGAGIAAPPHPAKVRVQVPSGDEAEVN